MDYAKLGSRAGKLITKYGTRITISHHNPGTFDPIHGHYVGGGTVSCSAVAIVKAPSGTGDKFIDGTLIEQGDRELVIGTGATLSPGVGDYATLGSVTWAIVGVNSVSPAGIDVVYRVLVRK
jgi:hypothetical protein